MENQELFKQAIADAKAVREAAISNAKAALEETFSSNIMSMLTQKINELEEDTDKEDEMKKEGAKMEKPEMEEGHEAEIGYGPAHQKPQIEEDSYEENKTMDEMDLEEILAELEKEEEDKMEEGKKKSEEEKLEETADADADDKMEEAKKDEEAEGDDEITELTIDELKDILKDVLKDVMGEKEEMSAEEEMPAEEPTEEPADDEKAIDLEELLAELAKDAEEDDKMEEGKKANFTVPANDADDLDDEAKHFKSLLKKAKINATVKAGIGEIEITVDSSDEAKAKQAVEDAGYSLDEAKIKKELEEAINTIKVLQSELNEVNLLNAKLLYTNKLFKAKSLSESQKVNVLKAFDRAENVKEAKKIYATLSESFASKAATKTQIKESVGFASKASGVAPKQPIVESDSAIRRMQQLAGIIK